MSACRLLCVLNASRKNNDPNAESYNNEQRPAEFLHHRITRAVTANGSVMNFSRWLIGSATSAVNSVFAGHVIGAINESGRRF